MYGHIIVCLLLVIQSRAFIENCHVDNSMCSNLFPPKLGVAYSGKSLACNDLLQIEDVKNIPNMTFSHGTEGSKYVLVFIDPDAPYPCANSDGSSFTHYAAVVKLVNGALVEDQHLVSYRGPHPPIGTHRYQFYLFSWSSNQKPAMHNTDQARGSFKLNQFQNENHLNEPVAVFQIRVPHVDI